MYVESDTYCNVLELAQRPVKLLRWQQGKEAETSSSHVNRNQKMLYVG